MSVDLDSQLEIEQQVIEVLSDYFPAWRRAIEVDSRLVEDLCMDSISLVEIIIALNESFGIELPEAEVGAWRTVGDLCKLIKIVRGVEDQKSV